MNRSYVELGDDLSSLFLRMVEDKRACINCDHFECVEKKPKVAIKDDSSEDKTCNIHDIMIRDPKEIVFDGFCCRYPPSGNLWRAIVKWYDRCGEFKRKKGDEYLFYAELMR